jgi:hypothetical protein
MLPLPGHVTPSGNLTAPIQLPSMAVFDDRRELSELIDERLFHTDNAAEP